MSGSDQIWAEALRTLERGQPFALATVVNVRGSTPREVGAKMIVREDGQFGTIGGGCGEAEVFRKARVLLEEKNDRGARLAEVDLTGDFDQREIGTCGGIMDVFVDLWSPARDLPIARRLADAAERSAPGALLTVVDAGSRVEMPAGSRTFIDPAKRARKARRRSICLRRRSRRLSRERPTRFPPCSKPTLAAAFNLSRVSNRTARCGCSSIRSSAPSG